MSTILFILDIEEGHVLPCFSLAEDLRARGHAITFLSVLDNEQMVREQGFEFAPIFEKAYPRGYRSLYKSKVNVKNGLASLKGHMQEIVEGTYDSILRRFPADLFIFSAWLRLDALVLHYLYKSPIALLSTYPRGEEERFSAVCIRDILKMPADDSYWLLEFFEKKGLGFGSLEQLVQPLDLFPELMACPRGFMPQRSYMGPHVTCLGPCMRKKAAAGGGEWLDRTGGKKIIYCSMGSQAATFKEECALFYRIAINMMRLPYLEDFHLVLAVGDSPGVEHLTDLPGNVTIVKWAPQIEILEIASLAIIHGGYGTVKECIYYGVPMIVLPFSRDQPANAKLVEERKLGVSGSLKEITESVLTALFLQVRDNEIIREHLHDMQRIFREEEQSKAGVATVEKLLAVSSR